jgi:hypothetical protein
MSIQLNSIHPDKDRAEVFLRLLDEKFEQLPFDWESLEESHRIVDAVKVTNHNRTLTITIIFVGAYSDAAPIAKANSIEDSTRWGCNGSMMYWVESDDHDKVAQVVGAFAGRE